MKSDVIHVTSDGVGVSEALAQAEATALFRALSKKDALHLRLLTEELMGMMQALTGQRDAEFWIEAEDKAFHLHLKANASMNTELRAKLLSAATTGENAAAKGVMGKLRDLFERALEPVDGTLPAFYSAGWSYTGADSANLAMAAASVWSLNRYKAFAQESVGPKEDWDELEKSIVANLADEVEISIRGGMVEMIIYKNFV